MTGHDRLRKSLTLSRLSHMLPEQPEISRRDVATAAKTAAEVRLAGAAAVIEGLGGHGVAGTVRRNSFEAGQAAD